MKRLGDGIIITNVVDVNMDYNYGICVMWFLSVNDDGIFLDDFVRKGKLIS